MKPMIFVSLLLLLILACEPTNNHHDYELSIPQGFPSIVFPADNEATEDRILLGKRLFYSTALSRDNSIACSNCHLPLYAFSDTSTFSRGVEQRIGKRNTPTLVNLAYHDVFLFEGSVPDLERQIFVPIQTHHEFDFDINLIVARLQQQTDIVELSRRAYGRQPDAFVLTRSIAAFERSLLSGNSPYDRYVSQHNTTALSQSQIRGYQLFMSDSLACSNCHGGFLLTNQSFENNGLYESYPDSGRMHFTRQATDMGRFKVPSLRNIALTAPYMHDGSKKNLSEVVEHYASGGKNHPNKNPLLRGFCLDPQQKNDLIAFLQALTDTVFIQNPAFRP